MPSRRKSTIVRKKVAYLALRGGMRATQAISRSAAAAWSERLFLTPRRYPTSERERAFLSTGRPARIPFGRGGADEIALWSWDGDAARTEPPVLLVHGWAGRAGQFAAIAPALAAAGRRVVAFDAPGHGASSGARCSLPELADAVRAVATWANGGDEGAPVALVAHSFGAPASVLAMVRRGVAVERAVFLAPAAEPMWFFGAFARALGLSRATLDEMWRRIATRFDVTIGDMDVLRMARGMRAPLLVVHDWADAAVPFAQGERLAEAWPGATLVTTAGLDHVRVLDYPAVVERVRGFIAARAAALQSAG